MARYIDADKFAKDLAQACVHKAVVYSVLDRQPTADVVPKSEVENLKLEYAGFEGATKQIIKGLKEEIVNVKNEVAREIFEETEETT